ncbi:peptide ABC transporter permease [Sporanaerobium hydrogeniformans]|uniref:Peptide ABC transporter permease n=1 Tax=Sporanaerobium hydrogeniformans TaxID=3072179 RepID=A0AC61DDA4_9FIRM|nr:ABC transporter permease [Sporanaerobium hydrogeniformans]PHV70925.1 peptide ABC transporter permease [Sporanaerobium hydrogeniformans]
MIKYIIKRLLLLIPVLLGVSIIIFAIMRVFSPDPAGIVLGQHATEEKMVEWRAANGLDQPVVTQYVEYMKGVFKGDFGTSYYSKKPVAKEIFSRFPATLELAFCAIIIASVFGMSLGVLSAVKKNSWIDNMSMVLSLVGVSMPIFWLGILLIIFFSGTLGWLPAQGRIETLLRPENVTGFYLIDSLIKGNMESFSSAVRHLVLPSIALAMYSMAIIARMTRSTMLETLSQDYIRTARAKGIVERKVIRKHALSNALIPIVTVIGIQLGSLMGGAVLTETVFAWPGIGKYTVEAIMKSDFPIVQGVVLLVAFIFVMMNLVVDIIYAFLDPRIKYS